MKQQTPSVSSTPQRGLTPNALPPYRLPPPPQRSHEVMQHQKLLVQNHPFPLLPELGEEIAQAPPAGYVEAEGLGEVLLRVLGGVGGDVVPRRDGDAAALKVDPGVVHPAVGLVHLAEGAAEAARASPVPVVVEKAVA